VPDADVVLPSGTALFRFPPLAFPPTHRDYSSSNAASSRICGVARCAARCRAANFFAAIASSTVVSTKVLTDIPAFKAALTTVSFCSGVPNVWMGSERTGSLSLGMIKFPVYD
jgi:hypothetical protein